MIRDVGDRVNLQHLVYNAAGALTNATVVLTVTAPDGTTSTPSVTNASTGTYTAGFTLTAAGAWLWVWTVSGTVIDVDQGSVLAASPGPITYASLPELKAYIGVTTTTTDVQIQDSLETASRWIDRFCNRSFGLTNTATARVFSDYTCSVDIDDLWTTTGLVVKTDTAGDGTYATTLASTNYRVEPTNGIVDGESGWPYYRLILVNTYPVASQFPWLQVTAKWGWSAVPGPVKTGCLLLASETLKLAREAPFGVAGFNGFGQVRIRDNPRVESMLQPYRRDPVLVA